MNYAKLAIALCLVVAACTATPTGQVVQEDITIGYIGPLSGLAAMIGISNMRGIEMAIEEWNDKGGLLGRQIKLVPEDDALSIPKAHAAYLKLRSFDQPAAILSMSYGAVLSLGPTADKDTQLLIESLDGSEDVAAVGEYVYAMGIYDESYGRSLAGIADEHLDEEEVALIFLNEDPITTLIADAFETYFAVWDGTVVKRYAYSFDETDFTPILLDIKGQHPSVDTIVLIGFDEAGFALRRAVELDLGYTFLGWDQMLAEPFVANAGNAIDGAYTAQWYPDEKAAAAFNQHYEQRYEETLYLPFTTQMGYTSTIMLFEAIEQAGTTDSAAVKAVLDAGFTTTMFGHDFVMDPDGIVRSITPQPCRITSDGDCLPLQ